MKLVTNILTILQQSKMIYYKCKAFSNKFDLVLGDICWSVSVTDLDDGRISLEGTSRKNQEQPRPLHFFTIDIVAFRFLANTHFYLDSFKLVLFLKEKKGRKGNTF